MSEKKKIVLTRRVVDPGPQLRFKTKVNWVKKTEPKIKKGLQIWKKVEKPNIPPKGILDTPENHDVREVWRTQVSTHFRKPGYVQKILVVTWLMGVKHDNNKWENAYVVWVPPDLQDSDMRPQIVEMLEAMGDFDQYQLWIDKTVLDYSIQDMDQQTRDLAQIKLRASPYSYFGCSSLDEKTRLQYAGMCVIVAILASVQNQERYKDWTVGKIVKEFNSIGVDILNEGASAEDIRRWCDTFYTNEISMRAFDPLGELLLSHVPPSSKNVHVSLAFIVNDQHCNPILDMDIKRSIASLNKIKFQNVDINYHFEDAIFVEDEAEIEKLLQGESDIKNKIILLPKVNLKNEAMLATKYSKIYLNQFKYDNHGNLTWFVHPKTHVLFVGAPDYHAVKYACEFLTKNVDNLEKFVFRGQSIAQLSKALYENDTKQEVPKSYICDDLQKILEQNYDRQMRFVKENIEENDPTLDSIDCKSSFDKAVLRMTEPIPVLTIFDTVEEYDGGDIRLGMYLLDEYFLANGFPVPSKLHDYSIVKVLLQKNYITKKHIRYQVIARHSMPCSLLQNHTRRVESLFPRYTGEQVTEHDLMVKKLSKNMTRHWYGSLGSRFKTEITGFITSDKVTVQSMALRYQDSPGKHYSFSGHEGMWMGRLREETPLQESTYPVYCAILGKALENLIDLMEAYIGPNTELLAVNTDNIVVRNPLTLPRECNLLHQIEKVKKMEKTVYFSKPFKFESLEKPIIKWNKIENIYKDPHGIARCGSGVYDESQRKIKIGKVVLDFQADLEALKKKSLLCVGKAGLGKSLLLKMIADGCLIVAPTNTAVANLLAEGIQAQTIDMAILDKKFENHLPRLIVDECFMVSLHHQALFERLKSKGTILQLFGDPNQTHPVENQGFSICYEMEYRFAKWVDFNRMDKVYIPGLARCDQDHFDNCETLLNDGKASPSWKRDDQNIDLTLAYTNDRVRQENDKYLKGTPDDPEARAKWYVGMRIICDKTEKGGVANNRMYRITSVSGENVTVKDYHNGNEIQGEFSKKLFSRAFSITIHSCQCMTITEKFRIVEVHMMVDRLHILYTAVTRARHSWQVHIVEDFSDLTFRNIRRSISPVTGPLLEKMGLIYLNWNDESSKVYVGKVNNCNYRTEQIRLAEHLEKPDPSHSAPGKWEASVIGKVLYHSDFNQKRLNNTEKKWTKIVQQTHKYEITNTKNLFPLVNRDVKYNMKLKVDQKLFQLTKWMPNDDVSSSRWRIEPDKPYEKKYFYYNLKKNNKEAKFKEAMKYHAFLEMEERNRLYPQNK
jgi:hypothetical protein